MGLPPCSAWPDVVAVTLISGLVNLSPLHRLQYTKIWVCMSLKVTCPLLKSWGTTSQIWGETIICLLAIAGLFHVLVLECCRCVSLT